MIGTVTPAARALRDEVEVPAVVEEQVGDQVARAGVGLALCGAHVLVGARRLRMLLRVARAADAEAGIAPVINSMSSLPCARPPSVATKRSDAVRWIAAQREHVVDAGVAQPVENHAQLVDGRVDAGQMRHRLDVELAADARDQLHGARAHRSARRRTSPTRTSAPARAGGRSSRRAGGRRRRSSAGRTRTRRPAGGGLRARLSRRIASTMLRSRRCLRRTHRQWAATTHSRI